MIDTSVSLEALNKSGINTLSEQIGMEYVEIHENELKARMPVDKRTVQQLGILHGGASASLAEMTGSTAAYLSINREKFVCVGQELKINHLKAVRKGYVYAIATPLHQGIRSHVWQIKTYDDEGDLVAFSTLTLAILPVDENFHFV
ncbi:MAG: hotdog fold thioesterase [Bacteroidetes bacterium]|nr:hotdog fold thioesterase [Bacteroidota bacterium]MBL6963171.1 hotdog fold thioesterase [Bacteroidota bacterium]